MKALILTAGRGRKFHPFSYYRPKPLFPIANRPLIEYTIDRLTKIQIKEIGIVVGNRGGRIRAYFGDGKRWGCRISYFEQPQPLGTGDAVLRSREWIGEDDFVVVYGDVYFPERIIERLRKEMKNAETGLAVVERTGDGDRRIAAELEEGKVVNYHWKHPNWRNSPVFCGIYGFKKGIWEYLTHLPDITEEVKNGIFPVEERELAAVSKLCCRDGHPLLAVEAEGTIDMDFPWQPLEVYERVVREMEGELSKTVLEEGAVIEEGAEIDGKVYVGRGGRIKKGAYLTGPVWVGENTVILEGSHILPHTVIGRDCVIGPYCVISGCIGDRCKVTHCAEFSGIVLEESMIVHYCQLSGIFGERSEIGAGTLTGTRRFDDHPNQVIIDGIKYDVPISGVLFGDYSRTGVGAMLMPGRIIGPSAIVGSGVVLMKNVEPFTAVLVKQEQEVIPWKAEIYDK